MKNVFKRILATVLAISLAFGCMTVSFAAGETIDWYWNSYGEEDYFDSIPYYGKLAEGATKAGKDIINEDDMEPAAYGLTAESEGFYRFTLGDLTYLYNNVVYFSEEMIDGKAYGLITDWELYQRGEDKIDFYVYLPEGETAILLQCQEELTISYEYLGKLPI